MFIALWGMRWHGLFQNEIDELPKCRLRYSSAIFTFGKVLGVEKIQRRDPYLASARRGVGAQFACRATWTTLGGCWPRTITMTQNKREIVQSKGDVRIVVDVVPTGPRGQKKNQHPKVLYQLARRSCWRGQEILSNFKTLPCGMAATTPPSSKGAGKEEELPLFTYRGAVDPNELRKSTTGFVHGKFVIQKIFLLFFILSTQFRATKKLQRHLWVEIRWLWMKTVERRMRAHL